MRLLIVDDEVRFAKLMAASLEMDGHQTLLAHDGEEALRVFYRERPGLVITDIHMPGMDGLELLGHLRAATPHPEVIMVTANTEAKSAVEAMKKGAMEYVTKPFDMDELSLLVGRAQEYLRLEERTASLERQLESGYSFENILGASAGMRALFDLMRKVADRDTLVLIRGESGTGKELVARALHFGSGRRKHPFVVVNCAAIPENLLESELFGHVRGAFTGADRDREGQLSAAGSGTLFLDEIGELPLDMQSKLLRVLQEREYRPVGGTRTKVLEARVVCATNLDLEEAVHSGEFREDLYHRLNVFPLYVPPLARRTDDIPLLARHFLKRAGEGPADLSPGVVRKLVEYHWPGNVRELANCMERARILAGEGPVLPEHFHLGIARTGKNTPGVPNLDDGPVSLDAVEKAYLLAALEKAGGNKSRAAGLLGISRRAIYSKLKTHGLGLD